MSQLPRFTDITLVLTEQCNLRCSYCYVPKQQPGHGRSMSREVAFAAVDRFLERAPSGKDVSISFFGGEPFLARELMGLVVDHAQARRPERLSFSAPTNGTLLDAEALALVRRSQMSLALSVDGTAPSADRPDTSGRGSLERLRAQLPGLREAAPMVRMTVTPDNVAQLSDNVRTLFDWGLSKLMHQPALEQPWSEQALDLWEQQHRELADWACQRYAARQPLPDLTVLEGIISRLGGSGQSYCGAGVTQAAVDVDGRIFGCFRSVFDPRAAQLSLGSVLGGPHNETAIRAYAGLDPRRARPQGRDSCKGCEARDGCTVYCAAMGQALLGDLRGVGHDACRLMQVQVEVCRDLLRRMRRLQRASRRRASAQVAAAALALGLGVGAGCDGESRAKHDGGALDGKVGHNEGLIDKAKPGPDVYPDQHMAPGLCAPGFECPMDGPPRHQDLMGPGLCPKPMDGPQPGVCPVKPDMPVGGVCPPPQPDAAGPGLCPPKPVDGGPMPGQCPIKVDLYVPKPTEGGIGPGLCPVKPDQGGPKPGYCPVFVDSGPKKDAGKPTPGVCPRPAKDAGKPQPGVCPMPAKDKGTPGLC